MTEIQQSGSVHPQTITKFSKGELDDFAPSRKRRGRRNSKVAHLQVNPMVWKLVKAQMESGGYTTFEIISEDEVIVR